MVLSPGRAYRRTLVGGCQAEAPQYQVLPGSAGFYMVRQGSFYPLFVSRMAHDETAGVSCGQCRGAIARPQTTAPDDGHSGGPPNPARRADLLEIRRPRRAGARASA